MNGHDLAKTLRMSAEVAEKDAADGETWPPWFLNINAYMLRHAADKLDELQRQTVQRSARMQIMRKWMEKNGMAYNAEGDDAAIWTLFCESEPTAGHFFDDNGVPL